MHKSISMNGTCWMNKIIQKPAEYSWTRNKQKNKTVGHLSLYFFLAYAWTRTISFMEIDRIVIVSWLDHRELNRRFIFSLVYNLSRHFYTVLTGRWNAVLYFSTQKTFQHHINMLYHRDALLVNVKTGVYLYTATELIFVDNIVRW